MVSSPVRRGTVTWTKATVQGAPKRAVEAATLIAPEGTNRSQLLRTTAPSNKSHPTLQPMQTSGTKSSHQASPAAIRQAPGKAPSLHAITARVPTSTKCYEPNCGKSFKDAVERKAHYVREHGFYKTNDKQPPAGRKSSLKKGQSKPGGKFSMVNRVLSEDGGN